MLYSSCLYLITLLPNTSTYIFLAIDARVASDATMPAAWIFHLVFLHHTSSVQVKVLSGIRFIAWNLDITRALWLRRQTQQNKLLSCTISDSRKVLDTTIPP